MLTVLSIIVRRYFLMSPATELRLLFVPEDDVDVRGSGAGTDAKVSLLKIFRAGHHGDEFGTRRQGVEGDAIVPLRKIGLKGATARHRAPPSTTSAWFGRLLRLSWRTE
jgi:hypothetical protein